MILLFVRAFTVFFCRREEAANRPKQEFVPKTLTDLHIEGIIAPGDGVNGTQNNHHGTSVIRAAQSTNQITRNTKMPIPNYYKSTPNLDPWSLPPQGILSFIFVIFLTVCYFDGSDENSVSSNLSLLFLLSRYFYH